MCYHIIKLKITHLKERKVQFMVEHISLVSIVKENQIWKGFADKMNEILRSDKEEKVKYWEIEKAFREAQFESDNVKREVRERLREEGLYE